MLHIGRNVLSLFTSRVLSAVILILIYFRLLNYLGPDVAGQFGLQASYLTVFAFFVDLGMQQLVIKKVSENREEAGKYLSNYFGIQFLLGLGFMLIMNLIIWNADYPALVKQALFVTSLGLLLSSLTMPFMAIINAYQRFNVIAVVNFCNSLINAGMMISAVTFERSIFYLAFIPVIVSAFDILIYAYIVHKKFTNFNLKFDFSFWRYLFILNAPFMFLTVFSIYNRIDSLLLPHLRNFTEAGFYTAAYKFWDMLAFLPTALAVVLYPYFANKFLRGEHSEIKHVLETYTRFMIALAIPVTIGAFMLADNLTLTFLKRDFLPAAPALWVLVAAVSVLMVYVPVNSIIISQRTKTATKITGFTLLFNLIANIFLVPKFGFVMAAVITLASELFQLIGYTFIVKTKIIDFNYFSNFFKPIIAGIAMGGVIYFFKDLNLFLLIAIAGLVYGAALLLLRFFDKNDWDLLKTSIDVRKKVEIS